MDYPRVSIVIVNYNGKRHLPECLKSIQKLDYPKDCVEVIVVDNGSKDGSVELLEGRFPWVRVLYNRKNEGFAKPSNDGARAATGEYVAFLNNDMRVERDWLAELVKTVQTSGAACAGSVILNWNGRLLDFAGGTINFYGIGHQPNYCKPMSKMNPLLTEDRPILFACGGAMLIDRGVFLNAGGFDEDYFAYYEDVDLGWRLRVLGYENILSVRSRVYHKHNSTSKTMPKIRLSLLYERNKLYTAFKNYGEELFNKVCLPYWMLEARETFLFSGLDPYDYQLSNPVELTGDKTFINQKAAVKLAAMNSFVVNLPRFMEKRRAIQAARKVDDAAILKFVDDPFVVFPKDTPEFINSEYDLVRAFGIDQLFGKPMKLKILLISNDNIGEKMAGPGIRYWEMAKSLAATGRFEVLLACTGTCDLKYPGIEIVPYSIEEPDELVRRAAESNILMLMGFVLYLIPALKKIAQKKFVVIDIYDPYNIESLEVYSKEERVFRRTRYQEAYQSLEYQMKIGDFFVCANSKQMDYWLGMLSAYQRVDSESYGMDKSGKKLIDLLPFGISDRPPQHTRNALKGVWPGIGKDDHVLIWGGGVWNWFDPLTLIRAVKLISEKRSDVKLFFMGVRHPNPAVTQMEMLNKAVDLAKELDVYDKYVFFNFGWVDYTDRQNYLLEADIGVSCHFETLETRFSFRTRILDYLWAGLPIICTRGDFFAAEVEEKQLGLTVDYEDAKGLADAVTSLLDRSEFYHACRENVAREAEQYRWSGVCKPLIDYCLHPVHLGLRDFNYKGREEAEGGELLQELPAAAGGKETISFSTSWAEEEELEEEEQEDLSREASVSMADRGVVDALQRIESRQKAMQNQMGRQMKVGLEVREMADDVQKWTYMMNKRFNIFKKLLNPINFFRRLFRRG